MFRTLPKFVLSTDCATHSIGIPGMRGNLTIQIGAYSIVFARWSFVRLICGHPWDPLRVPRRVSLFQELFNIRKIHLGLQVASAIQ